MKKSYYINKNQQINGDHEVHHEDCPYLPKTENRIYLGSFTNCHDAVGVAKLSHPTADGCKTCSPSCHTR